MCAIDFMIVGSGRNIMIEGNMVVYVARRGERSPSDCVWMVPGSREPESGIALCPMPSSGLLSSPMHGLLFGSQESLRL